MWHQITIAIAFKVRNTWRAPKRYADHRLRLSGELTLPHPDLRIRPGVIAVLGIAVRKHRRTFARWQEDKIVWLSKCPVYILASAIPDKRSRNSGVAGKTPEIRRGGSGSPGIDPQSFGDERIDGLSGWCVDPHVRGAKLL